MVLFIDFDDTIHDTHNRQPGYKLGLPILGAPEALRELHKSNQITIFTIWASSPERIKAIKEWLFYFDIPFDNVTNIKQNADYYIDNKALHFDNWINVLSKLSE